MLDASGTQHLLLAETLGLAMARRASDILERHRAALAGGNGATGTGAAGSAPEVDDDQFACDNAIFTAVLDAANECLGRFDTRPADDRWCDALLQVIYLAQISAVLSPGGRPPYTRLAIWRATPAKERRSHLGKPVCTGQDGYVRGDRREGATMRAGASLGWRIATAVAFGATAALAVTLSRGVPLHAALASAKGADAQRTAASAPRTAVTARCAASGLRISVGPGARVTTAITRYALEFTNVSRASCTLAGYPEVAAYRGDGVQVGAAAGDDSSAAARRVLLRPGQTAHAALDAAVPAARCGPVHATGLRVVTPGQTAARYVRRSMAACTARAPRGQDYLRVHAIAPGAGTRIGTVAEVEPSPPPARSAGPCRPSGAFARHGAAAD